MEALNLHYDVSGNDFTCAGEASGKIKKTLKELGFPNSTVRNVAIAVSTPLLSPNAFRLY